MEEARDYAFPSLGMAGKKYKVFGYVTNMDWDGGVLIPGLYERCGKSEEAHAVMKEDLAGGKLPSKYFGENAAWWWIMILSLNLNAAMKRLVLGGSWIVDSQADEGDPICADQLAGAGVGALSISAGALSQKPSGA